MANKNNLVKDLVERIFGFLNKGKILGIVTWLTTIFMTLSVALIKYMKYVSEYGKIMYWNISPSAINITGENVISDVILSTMFFSVVILFCLLPYFIYISRLRFSRKVISNIFISTLLLLLWFLMSDAKILIKNKGSEGVFSFIITGILFLIIFYSASIGLIVTHCSKNKTKKITITIKEAVIFAVVIFVVITMFLIGVNYDIEKNQTLFRITEDGYAIIYETDTSYYLAEYDNANNNINKYIQKIIDKSNVEYTWKIVNG